MVEYCTITVNGIQTAEGAAGGNANGEMDQSPVAAPSMTKLGAQQTYNVVAVPPSDADASAVEKSGEEGNTVADTDIYSKNLNKSRK